MAHERSVKQANLWTEKQQGVIVMSVNNLRTKRDNQQWMLDLALNMRGRVQNFERDDWETPKRAHNYRMLPKMWRQKAEHDEALGSKPKSKASMLRPQSIMTTPLKPTGCLNILFFMMIIP